MSSSVTRTSAGWSNAAEDRIELVEPNPLWRQQFELEAAALRRTLRASDGVRIEHFGSTAVPDLRSKPVIDILLIHPNPAAWPQLIEPLAALGYVYWAENPRKDQMFFVKGMPPVGQRRTHHVHVRVPEDGERELAFRDLLCADSVLAREYENLKKDLAERHPTDRDAYTNGKTEFVANAFSRRGVRGAGMTQEEINRVEWENPENWSDPVIGLYFSKRDSRVWVPKRGLGLGWTLNLGRREAAWWLIGLIVGPAVLARLLRRRR
jgi:GrpB-like predicted nucleotidyltransferase (UPF0157 family)